MRTVSEPRELQRILRSLKNEGRRIGFVPTMGYLHEGHLSLVRQARQACDLTVVSIFVNPIQFNNPHDLAAYPQDLERDSRMLVGAGVDILFTPRRDQMYREGFQSYVELERLPLPWEGAHRPGHFRGVSTVVCVLFQVVQPDIAIFGEKDFQQLRVIEQMVEDLCMPIEIVRGALVREHDGLAMSSRNVRLSTQGRRSALSLSRGLQRAQELYGEGVQDPSTLIDACREILERVGAKVEYVAIVDEVSLESVSKVGESHRMLIAAEVEGVRLIDNARPAGPRIVLS